MIKSQLNVNYMGEKLLFKTNTLSNVVLSIIMCYSKMALAFCAHDKYIQLFDPFTDSDLFKNCSIFMSMFFKSYICVTRHLHIISKMCTVVNMQENICN